MLKHLFTLIWVQLLLLPFASAQFKPLCTGTTNGFVVDFTHYRDDIYATGFFTTICGKNTSYVARWNGTQWEKAAQGGIDRGHALEVIDDALFIATYELGTDSNYVIRWNGTTLSTLGTVYRTSPNPNQSQTSSIYDILDYGDDVVIAGEFNRVAGQPMSGIASWDGTTWKPLGTGLSGSLPGTPPILYPHQLLYFEGSLIVCGNFLKAGDQTVNGIARWDGTQWYPLGEGFNNTVYGVGIFDGKLYAGGAFTASGTAALGRVARWNGTTWEHPGFEVEYGIAGVQAFVHTLREVGDSLYVAGGFNRVRLPSSPTPLTASGVVVWNQQGQINTLGGGPTGKEIEAIIPYQDGVLVGGGGSNSSGYVAVWKPSTSSFEELDGGSFAPSAYPNPAHDVLQLKDWEQSDYQLFALRDVSGHTFLQIPLTEAGTTVPLPDMPNGVYIAEFSGSRTYSPKQQRVLILKE